MTLESGDNKAYCLPSPLECRSNLSSMFFVLNILVRHQSQGRGEKTKCWTLHRPRLLKENYEDLQFLSSSDYWLAILEPPVKCCSKPGLDSIRANLALLL